MQSTAPSLALTASYLLLGVGWLAAVGALARPPARRVRRPTPGDTLELALASHALARIVATDEITAPLRAPFVERVTGDDGTATEHPRGGGMRRALGQLLTCPYCCSTWAATGLLAATQLWPAPARIARRVLAATAIANLLHRAHHSLTTH